MNSRRVLVAALCTLAVAACGEQPDPLGPGGPIRPSHPDRAQPTTDFADLPSPFPGLAFRTDSYPALGVVGGTHIRGLDPNYPGHEMDAAFDTP